MTPELFSDAMNEIGAKYVEEALTYKRPAQRSFWSKLEWIDEESNLHFSLDASGDEAVLRALAESVAVTEKTVDLSDGDEDENILTFDDIEGEKLPDEEAKP